MNENEYSCQVCDRTVKAGSEADQGSITIFVEQDEGQPDREVYVCGQCLARAGADAIYIRRDGMVQLATK